MPRAPGRSSLVNCNDFHQRLQRHLDDRIRPESDVELVRHTKQCEVCRGQLNAWRRVSSLMPAPSAHGGRSPRLDSQRSRPIHWSLGGLAFAASLVFFVVTWTGDPKPNPSSQASVSASITQPVRVGNQPGQLAGAQPNLDPARWWEQVHERDWVGQTMPTFRSVQQGVAPLGRTLMRAVTILTIGGREQTT